MAVFRSVTVCKDGVRDGRGEGGHGVSERTANVLTARSHINECDKVVAASKHGRAGQGIGNGMARHGTAGLTHNFSFLLLLLLNELLDLDLERLVGRSFCGIQGLDRNLKRCHKTEIGAQR